MKKILLIIFLFAVIKIEAQQNSSIENDSLKTSAKVTVRGWDSKDKSANTKKSRIKTDVEGKDNMKIMAPGDPIGDIDLKKNKIDKIKGTENPSNDKKSGKVKMFNDQKGFMRIVEPRDSVTEMPSIKVNDTESSLQANDRVKAGLENAGSAVPAMGRGITINTNHPKDRAKEIAGLESEVESDKSENNPPAEREIETGVINSGETVDIKKNKIDKIKGTENPSNDRKSGSIISLDDAGDADLKQSNPDINTSRSNIKRSLNKPTDSLQQKKAKFKAGKALADVVKRTGNPNQEGEDAQSSIAKTKRSRIKGGLEGKENMRIETGVINSGETVDIQKNKIDKIKGTENPSNDKKSGKVKMFNDQKGFMRIVEPRDSVTEIPSIKVNDTESSLQANDRVKAGLENAGSAEPAMGRGITINTSRSNIKRSLNKPTDSLQQKKAKFKAGKALADVVKRTGNPNQASEDAQSSIAKTKRSRIKGGLDGKENMRIETGVINSGETVDIQKNKIDDLKRGVKDSNHGSAHKPIMYVSGGYAMLSNETKEKTKLTNTIDINIGTYLPLIKKAVVSYGVNIDAEYGFSNEEITATYPSPFSVEGQVSSSVALIKESETTHTGYGIALGPQINFPIGNKLVLSPILQASYIGIKQNGFSIEQTINDGREQYKFTIQSQAESKTSFFAIKPRIRLAYLLNDRFSIWTELNYTAGSSIETTTNQFSPEGIANPKGQYTLDQMQHGTMKEEVIATKFNSFGFKLGMAVKLSAIAKGSTVIILKGKLPNL